MPLSILCESSQIELPTLPTKNKLISDTDMEPVCQKDMKGLICCRHTYIHDDKTEIKTTRSHLFAH